jgi:hypothetical protein
MQLDEQLGLVHEMSRFNWRTIEVFSDECRNLIHPESNTAAKELFYAERQRGFSQLTGGDEQSLCDFVPVNDPAPQIFLPRDSQPGSPVNPDRG